MYFLDIFHSSFQAADHKLPEGSPLLLQDTAQEAPTVTARLTRLFAPNLFILDIKSGR